MEKFRTPIFILFIILTLLSLLCIPRLKFSFEFEQFFPKGDPELEFFYSFIEDFETDDNYLLIAVENDNGVFDETFLKEFQKFSNETRNIPHVLNHLSLLTFSYPVKTPFGVTTIPAIHLDQPERYSRDSTRIMNDQRLVNHLISGDGKALVLSLKTIEKINLQQSEELITGVHDLLKRYNFDGHRILGIANFQKELVDMQKREIVISSLISVVLVSLIIFFLYRSMLTVGITVVSVTLGMILFIGFLSVTGREMNVLSALFPILMLIVGTSDIVHIMTKYLDELAIGTQRMKAIMIAIKEIGWATLLTSMTTAAGFASLLTSKIESIRQFGLSAAFGVAIAYFTVILFSTSVLSYFGKDQLDRSKNRRLNWQGLLEKMYFFSKNNSRKILWGTGLFIVLCFYGISLITTNYKIESGLPIGKKITEDFRYFEDNFAGFRPMEFAVFLKNADDVFDYEVIREINKLETHLKDLGVVNAVFSITDIFKSINMMNRGNRLSEYRFEEDETQHRKNRRFAEKIPTPHSQLLISEDGRKTRISSKIKDIGADSIKLVGQEIDAWIAENIDSNVIELHRTGTGLILDKNAEYIRDSLLKGLGLALLIVSFLMVLLFKNIRFLLISLVPNVLPLLFAAALIGYVGIELEAGVSILFAIVFGIAVDDTIHFLSKYKICLNQGFGMEESIRKTFVETGKAISYTSIILFFGFLVLFFSIYPPSKTVGLLISATLFSALVADLLIIPILIRKFFS